MPWRQQGFPGADEFVVSNTFSVAFWCRPEWGLGTIVDEVLQVYGLDTAGDAEASE